MLLKHLTNSSFLSLLFSLNGDNEGGLGGKVSPRKSVAQSACQYDVTSRVSNFQCSSKRRIKISIFRAEILFRFLGFGDFKVSIVIEN